MAIAADPRSRATGEPLTAGIHYVGRMIVTCRYKIHLIFDGARFGKGLVPPQIGMTTISAPPAVKPRGASAYATS